VILILNILLGLSGMAAPALAETLTRAEVVAAVLESHPEVLAGKQAWRAARGRHLQNISPTDPELEFEYEELPGVFDTGQFGERTIGATQKIPNPVKWVLEASASRHETEAIRQSAYIEPQLVLAHRAKIAFDRVLTDEMMLASAKENQSLSSALTQRARIRFEAGDIPKLELLRIEVGEAKAVRVASDAESRLIVSRLRLNSLLGRPSDVVLDLDGELEVSSGDFKRDDLRNLVDLRADVQGAEHAVASARASRSAAMAGWIPDLNLSIGRQTVVSSVGRESFWRTAIGLEIPLWAPFRQRGQMVEASANAERAKAEVEAIRRAAALEMEEVYQAFQTSSARVRLSEDRIVGLAVEAFRVAEESYAQGKATYLDVLGAQQALASSKREHIEALFTHRSALADLERTMGVNMIDTKVVK
jgi:outer membrane protein, heavy metal efflux system